MERYHSKFKVPDKNVRLRAIGQITNLPDNSLKKILSTADNYHSPVSTPKEGDWLYFQSESGQTFPSFYQIITRLNQIEKQYI